MEECSLDPYEEQLFKVFDSYDADNNGSLDKSGLQQLCDTLQLQEKSDSLIASLLNDRNRTRATFTQFKDALLLLLGSMQSSRSPDIEKDIDREVAPKYVVGAKKYGRRSRPRIDEIPITNAVQRSQSNAESNLRETYEETSFITPDVFSEEMLRAAWRKLGVGEDGFLNQNELVLVCGEIGLNKLADSVIRHLAVGSVCDYSSNRRISFQELLKALQHDDTWSEFLDTSHINTNFIINSEDVQHSTLMQHIQLGPDGSGYVNHESVIKMWENAGIASPQLLLHDLGFKHKSNIEVQELATMLEKEIRSMLELRIDHICNPLMALLQAFVAMHQAEIKCLKSVLQQLCDEKEKLQFDVAEANKRAALLAQEVDENVLKLEQKAQQRVKALESRHAEVLRDLKEQCSSEKEQLVHDNKGLEEKIRNLEQDEGVLRDSLQNVQKYLALVEVENKQLVSRVDELQQSKSSLEKHIDVMDVERTKAFEAESVRNDGFQEKILELQRANCELKDRNDEMISQIEELHREIQGSHSKTRNPDFRDDLQSMEGIGLGAKRRNGEFSSDEIDCESAIAGSPRIGKLRKFHESKEMFDTWYTKTECECAEDNECKINDEDVQENDVNIDIVQHLLKHYGIEPAANKENQNSHKTYIRNVEALLGFLLSKMDDKNAHRFFTPQTIRLVNPENRIMSSNNENMPDNQATTNSDRLKIQQLEESNNTLSNKCENLQQAIDLLGDEYERCEDYWQKKLENERAIYELEQCQSSEKLKELLAQLDDYEEQFLRESRTLGVIDESAMLEKQYMDLEAEYEDFRERTLLKLDDNELLIDNLRDELQLHLQAQSKEMHDSCVQTSSCRNLANLQWHQIDTFEFPLPKHNNQSISPHINVPSTSSGPEASKTTMPLKTKKNRRLVRQFVQPSWKNRDWSDSSSETAANDNTCATLPLKLNNPQMEKLQGQHMRFESQFKHVQQELRRQKIAYKELLNTYYHLNHNYGGEIQRLHHKLDHQFVISSKLQEKLTENDVLVGKLYIENAFLIKNNQRLEKQLHMLTVSQVNVGY